MTIHSMQRISFPSQIAALVLASALGVPALAQQTQPSANSQDTTPSATQPQSTTKADTSVSAPKEGFWGRVNPIARKKWVKRQVDPIKSQLTELDEVNAKNARDIQDVDSRAQAGIRQAQSTADAANQQALTASSQSQKANEIAMSASGHVDKLNTTVSGLDQYKKATEVEVTFRGGKPVLSADARTQLDDLAAGLTGRQGYILEIQARAPGAGSTGIQSSQRIAEAVKRYLVTEHEIPVYRLHSVALGNVSPDSDPDHPARVKTASVQIQVMENSLAAKQQ
jgi:hypothetical protein